MVMMCEGSLKAATEVATDTVSSVLGVINGITLLSGKYSWALIFLSERGEERREPVH